MTIITDPNRDHSDTSMLDGRGFSRGDTEVTGFVAPHFFDDIVTDRLLTHDLLGKVSRKWRVFYADPPWAFDNYSEKGEDRNANQHYSTMSVDDLMKMPVADIAEDDAVLALWVTDPTLRQAMHLLEVWGFEYKSVLAYWAKTWGRTDPESMHETRDFPIGNGYGTRANPEQLWLCTRGKPERRVHMIKGERKPDMSIRRLQFAPRMQHSRKPDKFRAIIERLYEGPYLELFTRTTPPGWGAWGNQVGLLDEGEVKTKKGKVLAPAPLFD